MLSYPTQRDFIKQCFIEAARQLEPFDLVAGVATAGIAHGALLADALQLPFVYVRSEAKKHGRQNLIEGEIRPGTTALVVEDLISTGGSSLTAVNTLRETGVKVKAVLAIFTYNFDTAKAAFENANCPLITLTDYDTLIREALTKKFITLHDLDMLTTWKNQVGGNVDR